MQSPLKIEDIRKVLGYKHGGSISRAENHKQSPSLEVALAYHFLFGAKLEEISPGFFRMIKSKMKSKIPQVIEGLRYLSEVESEARRRYLMKRYEELKN